MDFTRLAEKLMSMSESSWQRHANPWSVYTRFTTLPLISIAFWLRAWIGAWSVIPICLSLVWVWLNPRLFGPPESTDNWASMGTFGERIYLQRKSKAIPVHHRKAAFLLQILSAVGVPILIYGLYSLNLWATILGNVWIMAFKAWFVDRMVWLYRDVKDSDPEYQGWFRR